MIEGKAFCSDNEYRNHVCKKMREYYQKEQLRGTDPYYERSRCNFNTGLVLIFENGFRETPSITDIEKMRVIDEIAKKYFSRCVPFQEEYELFKKERENAHKKLFPRKTPLPKITAFEELADESKLARNEDGTYTVICKLPILFDRLLVVSPDLTPKVINEYLVKETGEHFNPGYLEKALSKARK